MSAQSQAYLGRPEVAFKLAHETRKKLIKGYTESRSPKKKVMQNSCLAANTLAALTL